MSQIANAPYLLFCIPYILTQSTKITVLLREVVLLNLVG